MKWLFNIIFLFFTTLIWSQNLVPNWSFETYTACPNAGGQLPKAQFWQCATACGEYYNSCSSNYNVPNYGPGPRYYLPAKDGNGYIALQVYQSGDYREYSQAVLIDTLINNNCYYAEFYVSSCRDMKYGVNNLAMNFSKIQYSSSGLPLNIPMHISMYNNPIIKDTINWVKISGTYKAAGEEKYMTIGNFKNNTNTDTSTICTIGAPYPGAYYFVDAVSVFSINPTGILPWTYNDTSVAIGDSVYIGNTMGGTFTSNWYTYGGAFITNGPGIYVKPVATSTYVVQFTVCGVPRSDTLKVTVTGVGVNEMDLLSQNIKLYPQPAQNILSIQFNLQIENPFNQIVIYNNLGQMIREEEIVFKEGKASMSLNYISDGVYMLQLQSKNQIVQKKLIIAR